MYSDGHLLKRSFSYLAAAQNNDLIPSFMLPIWLRANKNMHEEDHAYPEVGHLSPLTMQGAEVLNKGPKG